MGFYGNITNTSNTTFQFDRIYPNRLAMDANANNDGIFIGRYVLVEYQEDAAYPNGFRPESAGNGRFYFYSSPNAELITRIKCLGTKLNITENLPSEEDIEKYPYEDGFYEGEILQYQLFDENGKAILDEKGEPKIEFYKCVSSIRGEDAKFKLETETNTSSQYIQNFAIDEKHYSIPSKGFKGYDSTVWTKVSAEQNGKLITKYVNIADLNSVVPTFDLETDAPTMTPITPHFDADSTNVYYKLHTQPQWGLRVAEKKDETNSDGVTTWLNTTYDPITDTTITHKNENVVAAINYNGPAFEEQVDKNRKTETGIKKRDNSDNYITILPTGESGQKYYTHTNKNGEKIYETAPDIQEMRISLPAIGNMMSDAWDIIHGPLRNDAQTDENGSLQGRLDSFKAMEDNSIPIKRNSDGTFVGTRINGNTPRGTVPSDEVLAEPLSISFDKDDAWIRTEINTTDLDNKTKLSGISIHHTWNEGPTTLGAHDKNTPPSEDATQEEIILWTANGGSENIKLNTPNVDKAGHIVGWHHETVTLPYGYKTITTNGRGEGTEINTFDKIAAKTQNIIAENTQDELAINSGNEWIRIDTDATNDILTISHDIHKTSSDSHDTDWTQTEANTTIPTTTYEFDNAGHYVSHHTESYKLPFGYGKITGDSGSTAATATYDSLAITADDAWIETTVSKDKVNITHTGPVTGTPVTVANVEPEFGETFSITDWQYDSKGHKYGSTTHTVKIPDGSYTPANTATTHTDIITSLGFTSRTGAITSTKANTNTLTLYNYSANTNSHSKLIDIADTDTINNAFKKIQNHINSLNLNVDETINDTQIITSITQKNGQISLSRAAAGTLQLGTASTDGTIPENSSLNNAFNITNARFKANEEALAKETQNRKDAITKEINDRNTAISSAISAIVDKDDDGTINKLAEVIEWINNNPSTATQMQKAIQGNTKAISDEAALARSEEGKITTALTTETGRATAAEQANTTAIGNEKIRAENIEQGLQEQIDILQTWKEAATEEISQLQTTIENLQKQIDDLKNSPPEPDEGGEIV